MTVSVGKCFKFQIAELHELNRTTVLCTWLEMHEFLLLQFDKLRKLIGKLFENFDYYPFIVRNILHHQSVGQF